MLDRQQVERLVEGAIREVAGTERIPEGQPVPPEATLEDFKFDFLEIVEVEIGIEEISGEQIKFDDDNEILPTDSF